MYYSGNGKYQEWINVLEKFIPKIGTILDNNNINYFMNKQQLEELENLRIYANIYYFYFKHGKNRVKEIFDININKKELDPGIDSLVLSIIQIFPNINNIKLILYLMEFEIKYRLNNDPKYYAYQQVIKNIWNFNKIINLSNYKDIKGVGPSIGKNINDFFNNSNL